MCGYEIRQKKYVTYKAPGYGNGRRDYRLGPGYTKEDIIKRIANKEKELAGEPPLSSRLSRTYQVGLEKYLVAPLSSYQKKKLGIFYRAGHYLEEKNPYAMRQADVRKNAIHIDRLYEECRYMLKTGIKNPGDLQKRADEIKKEEAALRNRKNALTSVCDKGLLEKYQQLKKEMERLPEWDSRSVSLQKELSRLEQEMPEGFFSEYNREKQSLEERLRAVRREKRMVNRMMKEEMEKQKRLTKTEEVEQKPVR